MWVFWVEANFLEAKSKLARQLGSWRAPTQELARKLPSWRANLARQLLSWRAPTPVLRAPSAPFFLFLCTLYAFPFPFQAFHVIMPPKQPKNKLLREQLKAAEAARKRAQDALTGERALWERREKGWEKQRGELQQQVTATAQVRAVGGGAEGSADPDHGQHVL